MLKKEKEKKKREVIHSHRFPGRIQRQENTQLHTEVIYGQRCLPIASVLPASIFITKWQVYFLKVCRANTTNGKLQLAALTSQSL